MNDRIEKIKTFLKDSPKDCFLHHALALEYVKTGNDHLAQVSFETNITNDPSYVASYYHLAKLLERSGNNEAAIKVYEQGMVYAKKAGDMHSFSELQNACEDLMY